MRQDCDRAILVERISEFKSDPEKLRQAEEFVDQLIQQAVRDAEHKQKDRSKCVSIVCVVICYEYLPTYV